MFRGRYLAAEAAVYNYRKPRKPREAARRPLCVAAGGVPFADYNVSGQPPGG